MPSVLPRADIVRSGLFLQGGRAICMQRFVVVPPPSLEAVSCGHIGRLISAVAMGLFSACLPGTAAVTPMAALAPASSEALPDASAQNADLLMVYLSPSQKKEMREAFLRFDVDGSGAIDGQELKTVMESMGFPVSDEQAQAIISSLDLDGNNKVEWGEFASLMAERWLRRDGAADLEMALKVLSGAEEGSVDVDRMRKLMTTVGETPFSSSEWDDLMKMVDPTGTGR